MQKLVGSWGLGTAHEVILQVTVPRLDEVVGVDPLQRHFSEGNCPLGDAFVPDVTDIRDVVKLPG